MSGKILVLEIFAKTFSTNQISVFLKLKYLSNYKRYELDFLHAGTYPQKLQMRLKIFEWVWSDMPRHAQKIFKP